MGDTQPVSDYWQLKSLSAVADMDLVGTVETIKKALASDAVVQASSKSSDLRGGETTLGELEGFRAGGASPVRRQKGLDRERRMGERTRRSEAGEQDEMWGNREKRNGEEEADDNGAGLKRTEGNPVQGYPRSQASM